MDLDKLRGAIYFLGICILFAGCAASGGNESPSIHNNDYSYELQNISSEIQSLRQEINSLNEILSEQTEEAE